MAEQRIDLRDKFPELEPISKPPALYRINGCGPAVWGKRDLDPETSTYVKTWGLTFVFVPVLALRAYRVADAQSGWYFLGRTPLSSGARLWNSAVLVAALVVGGVSWWNAHLGSEEYRATQVLAAADEHRAAGELGAAARLYVELIAEHPSRRSEALARFDELAGTLDQATQAEAREVAEAALEARRSFGGDVGVDALYRALLGLVERDAQIAPAEAFALLERTLPLAPEGSAEPRALLETLRAALPDEPRPASLLAEACERAGELERCEALLAPHAEHLGALEGARILGQLRSSQERLDDAVALLAPYVEAHIGALHAAEKALDRVLEASQEAALDALNRDRAFRKRWEAATEPRQQSLVEERILEHVRADRAVARAQAEVARASAVVPAALDLGLVRLRRAQALSDPDARRGELEQAEQAFLAVQGQASGSAELELALAQVDYWLGKHAEGRARFDQVLETKQRDHATLMAVASALRQVGAAVEARQLVEEAFEKAHAAEERGDAALLRSLLELDLADRIKWLQECDRERPEVKAQLEDALGQRAREAGDDQEAVRHYRAAVAAYADMPESSSVLNNSSSACMALFWLTGRHEDFEAGLTRIERALAIEPANSIVLGNASVLVTAGALRELIGDGLDLEALRIPPMLGLLPFLFDDAAGFAGLVERVRAHTALRKATGYVEQAALLAPRNPAPLEYLLQVHAFTRDAGELAALEERIAGVELDLADREREQRDFLGGSNARLDEAQAELARYEATLARLRGARGATLAVAATYVVGQRMSLDRFGLDCDGDELVRLAEEAHAAAPSSATRSTLVDALSLRAVVRLAAQEPALQEQRQRTRRALPASLLLAAALGEDALRERILADEDVGRVLALARESLERLPEPVQPRHWALFRGVDPELAAALAERIRRDEAGRVGRRLDRKLSPLSASQALEACWELALDGKESEARALLEDCAARGVPLPFGR